MSASVFSGFSFFYLGVFCFFQPFLLLHLLSISVYLFLSGYSTLSKKGKREGKTGKKKARENGRKKKTGKLLVCIIYFSTYYLYIIVIIIIIIIIINQHSSLLFSFFKLSFLSFPSPSIPPFSLLVLSSSAPPLFK